MKLDEIKLTLRGADSEIDVYIDVDNNSLGRKWLTAMCCIEYHRSLSTSMHLKLVSVYRLCEYLFQSVDCKIYLRNLDIL